MARVAAQRRFSLQFRRSTSAILRSGLPVIALASVWMRRGPVWRREEDMAICSECEAEVDVDEFDVDRGDQLSCFECGATLVVSELSPLALVLADDESASDFEEPAGEDAADDDENDERD